MIGAYSSYLTYAVPLLLITGLFILFIDVKGYEMESWISESKTARLLGWINVILGLLLIGVNWWFQ
ncbi:CLC_0170 family protein [Paenibacillus sp. UNC451MF]|uniref:CLC_0170 family protein n=1 Tax=Paenibacillus sp. UNC451MF TaxID=1449063 RepID=UPI000491A6CF|nr:CLC_0170 family protein [Paenibacillus sp. UNC451MF]